MDTMPPHQLTGVVMLAAPTARSQAYIQTLVASSLIPKCVILMGGSNDVPPVEVALPQEWNGVLLPNLDESVASTCKRAGIELIDVDENDVNSEKTGRAIAAIQPDLVIYSGRGGQIVSERTLGLCPAFLHMHSGWLPEYRGSTTLYYALLEGELPGVTAIILDREIDTGPVVARRHYPRPPIHMDLDQMYDSAIRADLLARVMSDYATRRTFPFIECQNPRNGASYYVIHPVLKHLSILLLDGDKCE